MHREIAGERELAHLKEPELYRPKVRNRINLMTGGRYMPGLFLCPFGYRQSCYGEDSSRRSEEDNFLERLCEDEIFL